MNQVHIHLLINHLPLFGSFLGAIVLLFGIWRKSDTTKIAAYHVLIISAIGAVIAYLTGEGAEEAVEGMTGVSESLIEEHEEAAGFAYYFMIALGIVSLFGWWVTAVNKKINHALAWIILFMAVISFAVVARTALIGGKIHHSEISGAANSNLNEQNGGEEEDDD